MDGFGVLREQTFETLEDDMGKWADLAENLKKRDKQQLDDMNGFYGGGPTIENRIALADARAVDALAALMQVLAYLDAHDTETPND